MNMAGIGRIILYARDVEAMVAFYAHHFGFRAKSLNGDTVTELTPVEGGAVLLIQQAARQSAGRTSIELVFDVANVEQFVAVAADRGLQFGPIEHGEGYCYSQTRDPDGNKIRVSSKSLTAR